MPASFNFWIWLRANTERLRRLSDAQQRLSQLRSRMDRMYDDKLDGKIDEEFWTRLRDQFQFDPELLAFNNAGLSPYPNTVLDAMAAAGGIVAYLEENEPAAVARIESLAAWRPGHSMEIDEASRRSLELVRSASGGRGRREGAPPAEVAIFQGASFFRAAARGQSFGVAARGLGPRRQQASVGHSLRPPR